MFIFFFPQIRSSWGQSLIIIWILHGVLSILSGEILYSSLKFINKLSTLIFNEENKIMLLLLWFYNIKNQFQFICPSFSLNFNDLRLNFSNLEILIIDQPDCKPFPLWYLINLYFLGNNWDLGKTERPITMVCIRSSKLSHMAGKIQFMTMTSVMDWTVSP